MRRTKKTIFYSLMFVFTFLLTEFLLYVVSLIYPVYPIHSIPFTVPDSRLVYRPNPEYPDHDSNGFRNVAVPDTIDLVALGDSQTYGSGVTKEETWPSQLAEIADTNTYSMAFGGYGPVHGLILLDEAIAHSPDYIVYAFYAGNDLYDAYHLAYNLEEVAFLRSTDSLTAINIRQSNRQQLLEDKIEEVYNYKDKNRFIKILRNVKSFLFENSKIYILLSTAMQELTSPEAGGKQDGDAAIAEKQKLGDFEKRLALQYPEDCLVLEGENASTIFRPKYRGTALALDDPRINEGLQVALRAFNEMKKLVQEAGMRFFVVSIPTKELVFEDEVRQANILDSPAVKHYVRLIENEKKMWQMARTYFEQNGIEFADTLPYQKMLLTEGRQSFDASINEHLNPLGHLTVAECVRDKLSEM